MSQALWVTLSGFLFSLNLSKVLRMSVQPLQKFRQFCDGKDATQQGLNKGDQFHWNVYSDISAQGRVLLETNAMPESNFTIIQGTLTITEAGNSVPYSGKLDNLSMQPVKEIIRKVLKNDARKAFDILAFTEFDKCAIRVCPTGGNSTTALDVTTTGKAGCVTTNNIAMGKAHVKLIVDMMKERDIPPYEADDYYALSHPSTYRSFKDELEDVHKYVEEGQQKIMNGEMGRFESTRFIEQTFIPKGGAVDSATFDPYTRTADAWNNAKSSWAFFMGEDTVAEAIAIPEEMRGKIPDDYGRSKGIAWYYLGGFGIVHTTSNPTQGRIVKWESAA